jgi:hypothetical protein
MLRTMHLFAGHGGGLLADLILGHEPIVAVEWDGYACQVLRERAADGWFPDVPRVANGLANQSQRLKGIGNGQVPLQAATAWKLLGGE